MPWSVLRSGRKGEEKEGKFESKIEDHQAGFIRLALGEIYWGPCCVSHGLLGLHIYGETGKKSKFEVTRDPNEWTS